MSSPNQLFSMTDAPCSGLSSYPIFIRGNLHPEISSILSDDNIDTCASFGENTPFSNYDITVLRIDSPSATPMCPKMFFKMVYENNIDDYSNGIVVYTSTSKNQNNTVTGMTLCQGSQSGTLTNRLITKLYTCSCPPGCSLFIQIGSEALNQAKLTYRICEARSIE